MKRAWLLGLISFLSSAAAFAEETAAAATTAGGGTGALIAVGAGLAIGLAALGGSFGQGMVGGSAMEGIARNPQSQKTMFVTWILTLVFIESLSIYALVIALQLIGKI